MANFDSIYDVSSVRGSNLDLWVDPGMFFFTAEAMKVSHNAPVAEAGSLMVVSANNKTHVYQLYLVYASNVVYFRSKAGTTWTSWYTHASSESVESLVIVSADENNALTAGEDGGAYLSSEAIPDVSNLVASAEYDIATGTLSFYGPSSDEEEEGEEVEAIATVTIPSQGTVLKDATVEGSVLKLTWLLVDESTTETSIDLSTFVDIYTAGTGIKIENNEVSLDADYVNSMISSQVPDTSGFATKTELTTLEESLPDKYCLAYVTSDTGTSRIQNEVTGSGPMYHHTDGTRAYVGVHNGGADDLGVQAYVKNNTSSVGTRLNMYAKGAFYIPNKANTDSDYVADAPERELAVKGDIPDLSGYALKEELPDLSSYALKSELPDTSGFALQTSLDALEESLPEEYCIATVESATGKSLIQNEETGGGPKYWHTDGTRAYTGVNNGGADGIGAQTYVINNDTKIGTRINVFAKGAFYVNGKANTDADYVADDPNREIAVKGDIPDVSGMVKTMTYDEATGALVLYDTEDNKVAEVTIASSTSVIKDVELDGTSIKFTWILSDETETVTTLDLSGLVVTYSAGTGISIDESNAISADMSAILSALVEDGTLALASAIPDVSEFVTSTALQAEIATVTSMLSAYVTSSSLSAIVAEVEAKIPSLEGYATETYVDEAAAAVEAKIPDVTDHVISASYNLVTGEFQLLNTNGSPVTTLTIPSSGTVLSDAVLNDGKLTLTWTLVNNATTNTEIDLSDLIDVYTAGTGIVEDNNEFSLDSDYMDSLFTSKLANYVTSDVTDLISSQLSSNIITTNTNTTNIDNLQYSVDNLSTSVSNLETSLDNAKTELAQSISDVETSLSQTNNTVTSVQADLSALQTTVDGHTTSISSLQTTVDSHAYQLVTLQTSVNTNTANITSLQSSVDTNTANIATNTSNIASLQTDVSSLQTNIASVEGNVSSLQTDVSSIQNNVSSLTTSVTELAEKVSALTYDISLYFDSDSLEGGVHTFLPENASAIQLIKLEADGSGSSALAVSMSGDIVLEGQSMSVTDTSADCSTYAGYAVVFNVTGTSDQTKVAALIRCTLS